MTLFGDFKGGNRVEAAVRAHVEKWFPTYLRAVEPLGEYPANSLEDFRTIETSPEFDFWPEDQIPGLLIVSPGIVSGSVKKEGDGKVRAKWMVGMGCVLAGAEKADSNDLAKWYGIALVSMMLQHPSLGGFARGVELEDISYDELPSEGMRTQASCLNVFSVDVPEIVHAGKGMSEPLEPDEEVGDPVVAEKVNVTGTPVQKVE